MNDNKRRLQAKKGVPAFFLRGPLEVLTFGFFDARVNQDQTLMEIARDFQDRYNLTEDDYSQKTMVTVYDRMRRLIRGTKLNEIL